ncbi:MAG TPA: NAD(P)/FAD-dependent oxidoreductase [Caulobacteraceae bacterium]|nr:NAD(P)/FAD-dependent oxidoreductase [Caulobacteraceae bacterium]
MVVGAGFAGLQLVKGLRDVGGLAIHLIDKRNHHIFQPLLYQAATSILPPSQVAWPIRHLVRDLPYVTTWLAEVTGVDLAARRVMLSSGRRLDYDTLVLATGATHAYFGHDDWIPVAPGLKTLEDATHIRRRILLAFERAEAGGDDVEALLTFVIVGAGPTGVELAGTIAELARTHLPAEYRGIDTRRARVLLIEAGARILPAFDPSLAAYAHKALIELGVEVRVGEAVTHCDADGVTTSTAAIPARTVLWAAGIEASGAARWLGLAGDRAGRSLAEPDLSAPGLPQVFVIGDTALVAWQGSGFVPGLAPAAKQQGAYVAKVLRARLAGAPPPPPFRYRHEGSLATIGRNRAIIDFGRIKLKGPLAWWLWGVAHIYFLIGTRSRLAVALNWLWAYARNEPSAWIITGPIAPTGP